MDSIASNFHKAARWYAEHGFPVFPCVPRAKNPLTRNGFKNATTDLKQIDQWWKRCPQANVAIPMGKASGLIAIDVDPRHGGRETWDSLMYHHGPLPDTAQQITGRCDGGFHAFFRDPGVRLPETLGPGVDVQGEGTYVMAAPSIHPDSGKPYVWDGLAGKEALLTPAGCPAWMLEPKRTAAAAGAGDVPKVIPPTVSKGMQHKTLVSLAGTMRQRGCEFAEIFAALVAMNPRLEEPAPEANLRKIAESVCKYEAGKITLEEPPSSASTMAVDANAPTPLEELNRDRIFRDVGIAWTAFQKRGKRIEAATASGRLVIWDSAGDVLKFSKSEAAVADALGVVLPKPAKGHLSWRRVAALILQVAEKDRTDIGDPIRLDMEEAIQFAHSAAGYPCPVKEHQVFDLIQQLREYHRDPRATDAPRCVFTYGGDVYVHRPTLRLWLSTPAGHNRLYPVSEMHAGLLATGFARVKDFRVQVDKERLRIDLWKGPITALGTDQTEIVQEPENADL